MVKYSSNGLPSFQNIYLKFLSFCKIHLQHVAQEEIPGRHPMVHNMNGGKGGLKESFPTSTLVVPFVSLALYAIWQKNLSFVLAIKSVWGIRLIVLWLPCRRYCTSFRDKEKRLWYTGMIANQRKVCVAPVLCCLNIGINNRQTKCPWKQLIVFSKGVAKQIFWSFSLFFYSTSNTAITLNGGHFGPIILSDCMTNWTCIITQKFPLKNKSMRCHTIVWPFHWRIILLRLNKDSQPNEYPSVFIFKFLHWNIIRVW